METPKRPKARRKDTREKYVIVRIPFDRVADLERFYAATDGLYIGRYVQEAILARLDAEKETVA